MKLTPQQIQELVQLVGKTRDRELNCEECLQLVAEFAEVQLAGKPIRDALEAVEHHISVCSECREEYEALRRALENPD